MSSSTNTQSSPTYYIKNIYIFPSTPPASPYIKTSDLENTANYIHTEINSDYKLPNNKITDINYNITDINDNISAILATLADANNKQKKQEEKITELSSKISTYE